MMDAEDRTAHTQCNQFLPALAAHIKARLGNAGRDDAAVLLRVRIRGGELALLAVEPAEIRADAEESDA